MRHVHAKVKLEKSLYIKKEDIQYVKWLGMPHLHMWGLNVECA